LTRYLKFVNRFATDGTILIDGATGTEAERRGVPQLKNAWNGGGALSHPDIIRQIHLDYIGCGAEIIISNTFATNKHALSDAGEDHLFEEYNSKAVQLAIEARELARKDDILVAGGISYWRWPEGLPDKEQLYSDISEQAKIMATSGADLIMLEMMSDLEFTLITLRAAQTAGLPVWVGLSCKKNDKDQICLLMSDMLLADALLELKKENVPLLNIMHTEVDIVSECLDVVDECWPNHVGVYAHSGIYKNPEWIFDGVISPSEYAKESEKWIERKINILGGCCGIGADHIKCINKILRSKSN